MSALARHFGIALGLLFTWRRQLASARGLAAADVVTFVPAAITCGPAAAKAPAPVQAGRMEIVLGGGERVIVGADVDATALARVVKVLSRR